jgi:hypothetical protein
MTKNHGRINNIVKVISSKDDLKIRKSFGFDRRESFRRELSFYQWCINNQINQIPQLLSFDEANYEIFIEYISGSSIRLATGAVIQETIKFIQDLNSIDESAPLQRAAEGILEPLDLLRHVEARIKQVGFEGIHHPSDLKSMASDVSKYLIINPPNIGSHIVSPSDLGLHNCIRGDKIYFFDFEYAGIDSQLKLIIDYVFHPANGLNNQDIELVAIEFARSLGWTSFSINYKIMGVFKFWWLLRTLNSISESTIKLRTSKGLIQDRDCTSYIESRVNLINKLKADFDEYFYG